MPITSEYLKDAGLEGKIPFVIKIKNVGNCKANDINIQIHMPTGVRIFSKVMLEELKEPKAPETLENPINSFYSKSYLGAATSSLENIFNVGRGIGAYNISPLTNSFSINNDEEIKDNCLNIWNRSMIHTGEYESEEDSKRMFEHACAFCDLGKGYSCSLFPYICLCSETVLPQEKIVLE